FARRALASERAAIVATTCLLCDGVYLVQSRIAMTNIFAVLFQVAAALFVVRAATSDPLPVGDMTAAGVCLGLALSTRWTSLWAEGFLGLVLLAWRRARLLRLRAVVGLAAGDGLGARDRHPRARSPPPLLRPGFPVPVPALGPGAAQAQLQP